MVFLDESDNWKVEKLFEEMIYAHPSSVSARLQILLRPKSRNLNHSIAIQRASRTSDQLPLQIPLLLSITRINKNHTMSVSQSEPGFRSFRHCVSLQEMRPCSSHGKHPLSNMKHLALREILCDQQLKLIIDLCYTISSADTHSEVSIALRNVSCHPFQSNVTSSGFGNKLLTGERAFPSRIIVSLIPPTKFLPSISALRLPFSSKNPSATVSVADGAQMTLDSAGKVQVTASMNRTVAIVNEAWRIEAREEGFSKDSSCFIGTLDYCLHDPVSGLQIVSAKPTFWDSWSNMRYEKVNSPLDNEGGVSFAEKDGEKEFKWIFRKWTDLHLEMGRELIMDWGLKVQLWVTYFPNNINTRYRFHVQREFLDNFKLEIKKAKNSELISYFLSVVCFIIVFCPFSVMLRFFRKSLDVDGDYRLFKSCL